MRADVTRAGTARAHASKHPVTGSVHADMKEGVLTLSIKTAPGAQSKKIAIQSAAKKS